MISRIGRHLLRSVSFPQVLPLHAQVAAPSRAATMQKCLCAHSGELVAASSAPNPKFIVLKHSSAPGLCVRVDKDLVKEIEARAKRNPNSAGCIALDQLLRSFEASHQSPSDHDHAFLRWVPERIAALQDVSSVLCGYGFAEQNEFLQELERIRRVCESTQQLTDRFPGILATTNDVKLPPRLCALVPSKPDAAMSLFKFLTLPLALRQQDPVKHWEDKNARLRDASIRNAKEALHTRAQYDAEIRKCEDARAQLKDCLVRSQQFASSAIADQQSLADSKRELEQACNLITAIFLSVKAAQVIMVKAKKEGTIHNFDAMGNVFMKWRRDIEIFEHSPVCLDAFLTEVRQRRAYHACLAAFDEIIHSRLEAARDKEAARRADFQNKFSDYMPAEFREMLIDPVPTLVMERFTRRCG